MKRRESLKNIVLLGGTVALSGSFLSLLQSCKEQAKLSWKPRFLSGKHAQLVSSLVDTLLPKTDTPGGLDVKVDVFIDLVYDQMLDEATQKQIVAAMDQFNEKCVSKAGDVFANLDAKQKKTILMEEEANSPQFGRSVWGKGVGEQPDPGFYRSFKGLAVQGYFTSAEVGKNVTAYDPVPGPFQGCIPFSDVGKVWSL